MKYFFTKTVIIVMSLLLSISYSFASFQDAKESLLVMPSGIQLIEKIDIVAIKIINLKAIDRVKIENKISRLQAEHDKKNTQKSQKIVMILDYLDGKITQGLPKQSNTGAFKRIQKINFDKYKNSIDNRIYRIKIEKYKRTHIKR